MARRLKRSPRAPKPSRNPCWPCVRRAGVTILPKRVARATACSATWPASATSRDTWFERQLKMESQPPMLDRYARQIRFAPLGEDGQRRLLASRVLVCGCGALGSVLANTLARAGVGKLRIVDRDFVETTNLQRQVLFDEDDVAANLPKAIAAASKLRRINSQIEIEPVVADVDHLNVLGLLEGVDCI